MSNYAFTGILDKLPHRWPNFTTGEKRLVTVLRYKSLLVTLYFFYPSNFSSISPLPPPLSSSSLHPPRDRSIPCRGKVGREPRKTVLLFQSRSSYFFFLSFSREKRKKREKKETIFHPPHKENRVNLSERGFSPSPQPCPASTLQPN